MTLFIGVSLLSKPPRIPTLTKLFLHFTIFYLFDSFPMVLLNILLDYDIEEGEDDYMQHII